jgi:hypothetical protein
VTEAKKYRRKKQKKYKNRGKGPNDGSRGGRGVGGIRDNADIYG